MSPDCCRIGGPIEPVPGSHFKSHVNSSAYEAPSEQGARRGCEHKTDSHRGGGEASRLAHHPYRNLQLTTALSPPPEVGYFWIPCIGLGSGVIFDVGYEDYG